MTAAALFDLDGTLIDTAPDIHAAAAAMLEQLHLPPLPFSDAREYIGDGVVRFVKRTLTRQWWGEPQSALLQQAEKLMYKYYAKECTARLLCYDGVAETLRDLQKAGLPMACVTNKPAIFTKPLLDKSGLAKFFATTICGDTLPVKKPHPQPLFAACEFLNADINNVWMVGDSAADSKAATAAGCKFAVVAYGYHRASTLPPADRVLHKFADTLPLLGVK